MAKVYRSDKNVYEAAQERLEYIFNEFESVCVAFSGGKDSGVLLNLAYDCAKANNMLDKLSVYHLDYEAQYQDTTDYVEDVFLNEFKDIEKYWLCLPISAQCAVSMYQDHWVPWEKEKREIWARAMPDNEHVINEDNVPFKFNEKMWDYDTQANFGRWYAKKHGKTAMLVGIRADESLNRQAAITSAKKVNQYNNLSWATKDDKFNDLVSCYPIYDWTADDIWVCNAKLGYKYNELYDLYWQAGLSIHQMRVASPFNDCATDTLKLYKAADPNMWGKMVGRVNGANFSSIYGGTVAMGWKNIKLPKGHTWKTYLEFLLTTLPEKSRSNYLQKFNTSLDFWGSEGGVLSDETIKELESEGKEFEVKDKTNYNTQKKPVVFKEYPDDTDAKDFKSVPSYKRMCICILKNDHTCKYMGFAQTKKDKEKRQKMMSKYKDIIRGKDCE